MRRPGLLLALATLAACRQSPSPAAVSVGTFAFTMRHGTSVLTGLVDANRETIMVPEREGSCYVDRTTQIVDEWLVFRCEGVPKVSDLRLSFDRRNPQAKSHWSGTVTGMVSKFECIAYTTDARGNRICSESRTLRVEETGTASGSIIVRRRGQEN